MNYTQAENGRLVCVGCGRDVMEYHKRNCAYTD